VRVALLDPPGFTPQYDDRLAVALAGRGHTIDLLTSRFLHGDVPEPHGYRREELFFPISGRLLASSPRSRLRYPVKALEYVPSVRALLRRLDALAPDIAHIQWLPLPAHDLRWIRRLARKRPTVYTAHNATLRQGPERRDLWRQILTAVDGVVVKSHRGVERLADLGVDRGRIVRIPHPAFDEPGGATVPPTGTTLLFFGLLRAHKGLDLLVEALPAIAAAAPDVRLVVAGDEVDPLEPVHRVADELGVAGRIEWRLGYLPEPEVAELMRAATLVVLPYREADASGVLATAIGHGRPAVVSDVGTLGETVEEFSAGAVVPPGDVAALAAACQRLLTDRDALAAAARGAEAARAALTWDAAAAAHEELYEDLIARRVRGESR
jgi:glycosyltransferase involved in cell wall biosynthesis